MESVWANRRSDRAWQLSVRTRRRSQCRNRQTFASGDVLIWGSARVLACLPLPLRSASEEDLTEVTQEQFEASVWDCTPGAWPERNYESAPYLHGAARFRVPD
jgi:hypothetical protein